MNDHVSRVVAQERFNFSPGLLTSLQMGLAPGAFQANGPDEIQIVLAFVDKIGVLHGQVIDVVAEHFAPFEAYLEVGLDHVRYETVYLGPASEIEQQMVAITFVNLSYR